MTQFPIIQSPAGESVLPPWLTDFTPTGLALTHTVNDVPTERLSNDELSDDLPPVQPPSAGFIIQLFVVPGLIVLAVVLVWALFGRIAAGEQDWQTLVQELQSPNSHIRKRAMYGLARFWIRIDAVAATDNIWPPTRRLRPCCRIN